jgi:hypothetical protein
LTQFVQINAANEDALGVDQIFSQKTNVSIETNGAGFSKILNDATESIQGSTIIDSLLTTSDLSGNLLRGYHGGGGGQQEDSQGG